MTKIGTFADRVPHGSHDKADLKRGRTTQAPGLNWDKNNEIHSSIDESLLFSLSPGPYIKELFD